MALIVVVAIFSGDDESDTATSGQNEPAATAPEPEPEPAEPETAPTPLKQQIERAVSDARDNMSKFEWDGKIVTVTYDVSDEGFWDEDSFVGNAARESVDVLEAGFAFPKVNRVNVIYLTGMTDQYGNTETEPGVEIDWTRKLWANVEDPEAFKVRLLGDEALMYKLATWHYIHLGIYKDTDLMEEGVPAIGKGQ